MFSDIFLSELLDVYKRQIGSITTGPSLFLLKKFYPEINPADCLLKDFPQASVLPIPGRGRVADVYKRQRLLRTVLFQELPV